MKTVQNLQLSQMLRDALQAARDRIMVEFDVDRMVVFGSAARGELDEESDADLLVVLTKRPDHRTRDRITRLILDINLEYDTNLSELIVDRETWDHGLGSVLPIHQEVEEEGVRL
ncbi:MAG: hypothetical protein EXS64_01250 [Candidatus Latescibacteria bacterium]|nr:hypothetical protein [Candidatus Latescibacterota bacterium]